MKSTIFNFSVLRKVLLLVPILLAGALSGCASGSVWHSYPSQVKPIRQQVQDQLYQMALKQHAKLKPGEDAQLWDTEQGRLDQMTGNFKGSQTDYAKAIQSVQQQQLAPKVQIKHILSDTGSLFVNANVIPFRLRGYEIVLLYEYQALNYLMEGDLSDALVSTRRADGEQAFLTQLHAKALLAAKQKAEENDLSFNPQNVKQFKATMAVAAKVKSSFQNAFSYYMSAILYEAAGDYNDAFVSIKNALGVDPTNPYIQQKLLEILEERGNSQSQINQYKQSFGMKQPPAVPKNDGQVVIAFDEAWVPLKQQVTVPIFVPGLQQVQTFVFPVYNDKPLVSQPLSIQLLQGKHFIPEGNTALVTNVQALAAKALVENYPIIFTEAALRVVAKGAMTLAAGKDNWLLGIVADIYSVASNRADLRSWSTLPQDIQVMQMYLPAGQHAISLGYGQQQKRVTFSVPAGKTEFIWVITPGDNIIVHQALIT